MQTQRYHFTSVRMVIIKKSINNKCWRGCGERGTLLHCWWECKLVKPLRRTVWRFLKKLKIELPYNLAIPFLGILPRQNYNSERCGQAIRHSRGNYIQSPRIDHDGK
uniref:Uncharacterized protein n=1 Tax=Sus scrofa TaxID=9823 RepID=A0A8D0R4E7_PIG